MILQSHFLSYIQIKTWSERMHAPQCSLQHRLQQPRHWSNLNVYGQEWIKMWYTYAMEYYSAIKKWNNAICSNMDGPRDHHTNWSKSDKNESCSVVSDFLWPHGLYTVHGILQARILEWVAFPSSRGSSQPRNRIQVSCIAGRLFPDWAIWKQIQISSYPQIFLS